MAATWANEFRPKTFDEMVGNRNLFGPYGTLRREAETGSVRSHIFFGPPGTGKTTAAQILATYVKQDVVFLNATDASVKDIKAAKANHENGVLVYLDEIQAFNRKQQQSLLPYVEDGSMTLIAATTENPWHCCYDALLSRTNVVEFRRPTPTDIEKRLLQVLEAKHCESMLDASQLNTIAHMAHGDVRCALNTAQIVVETALAKGETPVSPETLKETLPNINLAGFDTNSDVHYSLLAALQKSIRGSDVDAAIFYLSRLLEGEDLISPSRRLLVIASEDIGLADPGAITHTLSCVEAAERLGFPEAWKPLTQATIYLALAPKSYSVEEAYGKAREDIAAGFGATVPKHIAKGCPKDYVWPQDRPYHWANQQYMPDDLIGRHYYDPHDSEMQRRPFEYWQQVRQTLANTSGARSYHPNPELRG